MKHILLVAIVAISFLFSSATPTTAQQKADDCKTEDVKAWMIGRQIGRNRLQPLFQNDSKFTALQEMLLIQQVRRDLEDLKRPVCATDLYNLTIYFYDALVDLDTFHMAGDTKSEDTIRARIQHYTDTVDSLYLPLQTIAGVDVEAEANKLQPVATAAPTAQAISPISFEGKTGGEVLGPTDFPSGTYRITLTGVGLDIQIKNVSGSCIGGSFMYLDSKGGSVEEVFQSDQCRALIQVGQTDQPWTLKFDPVQ